VLPAAVRAQVESRIPSAFAPRNAGEREALLTGIPAVDAALGGIPRGTLSQLCAPAAASSGKTALLYSLLAQATAQELPCALVDAGDSFDPHCGHAAGIVLARLLWVRCPHGTRQRLTPLEQAFKCADILLQGGGFSLIALDLSEMEERQLRNVPLTTWFRFSQVVEKLNTAFIVLSSTAIAASCVPLVLQCSLQAEGWSAASGQECAHARILRECEIGLEALRCKRPSRSVAVFSAETKLG
jgi:hypothetical protein